KQASMRRLLVSLFIAVTGGSLPTLLLSQEPTPEVVAEQQADDQETPDADIVGVPSEAVLEGPVDRRTYTLGPGDVLTIALFGFRSRVLTIEVAPEGTIIVPEVGIV